MDEDERHHAKVSRWRRTKQVGMDVKNATHLKRFMYLVFLFWGEGEEHGLAPRKTDGD